MWHSLLLICIFPLPASGRSNGSKPPPRARNSAWALIQNVSFAHWKSFDSFIGNCSKSSTLMNGGRLQKLIIATDAVMLQPLFGYQQTGRFKKCRICMFEARLSYSIKRETLRYLSLRSENWIRDNDEYRQNDLRCIVCSCCVPSALTTTAVAQQIYSLFRV